jgi:hypothetical protein
MEHQDKKASPSDDRDIDLGTVLRSIGRAFSKIGWLIKSFFLFLGGLFLYSLIFLKKRAIWLIIAGAIGFAYGYYLKYSNGNKYYSSFTARFNFGSSRSLYNTIDYLNSLIADGRLNELSKLFSITEKEAAMLIEFEAEAIKDEIILTDLYRQEFFDFDRNSRVRTDTFWTKTVTYKEFKSSLTKYDMPLQRVTVTSTKPDIFPKLQPGFIKNIVSDGILMNSYKILKETQQDEERIVANSLTGLDTLRAVYNERLRKDGPKESSSANLTVLEQSQLHSSPELELYDKMLTLKDELRSLRKKNVNNQEIVQVLASFNSVGKRVSILKESTSKYAFWAIIITLLILVAVEVYKALDAYEKKNKKIPAA